MSKGFNVGDWVEWQSQAGGHYSTKRGVIVAIVPQRKDVYRVIPDHLSDKTKLFDGLDTRTTTSYLVAVPTNKGRSCRLYWPRTIHLKHWDNQDEISRPELQWFLANVVNLID